MPHIPKGVYKCASHNPNARATPNYLTIEEFAQTHCVMSTLKVLQSFLMQQATFFFCDQGY
jgi:hypothetical protein